MAGQGLAYSPTTRAMAPDHSEQLRAERRLDQLMHSFAGLGKELAFISFVQLLGSRPGILTQWTFVVPKLQGN